ncbi:hypothetical protein MJO28_003810 [Puccinia striiformis f. sp. tritici]|uniref:Uncharacterized protein n=1 Tax=Puccinia striiformis f. sp. tritici TaxID=168172 RepID=A0ACC0EMN2_9BASI|nr:hypothetical protein MJO28_003810 [Puccinia striiformis f. sp. tritici]
MDHCRQEEACECIRCTVSEQYKEAGWNKQHSTNFVGKEFRVVLQAAPVVFFEYMLELQQDLWGALCQLLPLTFQTHIKDMSAYQQVLQDHIRWFLFQFAKSTAQWVNQPQLHMLLHLLDLIILFATKKFKSYNSVLRNASIHYNCRSPGHDIPVMFANHILSGGFFWNTIQNLFYQNPSVQKNMGYNAQILMERVHHEPQVRSCKVQPDTEVEPPVDSVEFLRGYKLDQIGDINLNQKDKIMAGTFILLLPLGLPESNICGRRTQEPV